MGFRNILSNNNKQGMKHFTEKIEQQNLKNCNFSKPLKRFTDDDVRERNRSLYLAMLLGNNFKSDARIVFNTNEGYKEVFSTVWATTEKFILLKGGNFIPLEAIAKVDLQ
jgi:hypothetical protein